MADRVRAVQERRRSSAAGPHGRRPTRASELEFWIAHYDEDADLGTAEDEHDEEETT